ncbi:MAG: OmpA family protein [Sphingomicrobium sp.]
MRTLPIFAALVLTLSGAAGAQVRRPGARQPVPVLTGIDALRADFLARTGSNILYFGVNSAGLGAPARAVLGAQAAWLRRQPAVVVQVEGYGDPGDSRDHALAMGARRAQAVRDYLVLLGVPSAQVALTSWGKTRPGAGRAIVVLVR